MPTRLTRRRLLELGALTGVTSMAGGCAWFARLGSPGPMPQPSPLSARAIDVHCHIFNGADLPIRGFVEDVVLSLPDNALAIPADALVDLVCAVIKGQAISASKEAALLRSGSHVHALSLPLAAPDDLFRSRVTPAIDSLRGARHPSGDRGSILLRPDPSKPLVGNIWRMRLNISAPSGARRICAPVPMSLNRRAHFRHPRSWTAYWQRVGRCMAPYGLAAY